MISHSDCAEYRTFRPSPREADLRARFLTPSPRPVMLSTGDVARLAGMSPDQFRLLRSRYPDNAPLPVRAGSFGVGTLYLEADVDAWLRGREAA